MQKPQGSQLTKSRLGTTVFLSNGFRYTKRKQLPDGSINWRCETRSCPGSIITESNNPDDISNPRSIIQHKQHSHLPHTMNHVSRKDVTNPTSITNYKCQAWLQGVDIPNIQIEHTQNNKQDGLDTYRELLISIRNIPLTMKDLLGLKKYKHEIGNFPNNNIMSPCLLQYLNKVMHK
jgi:hypothetical protein